MDLIEALMTSPVQDIILIMPFEIHTKHNDM